MEILNISRIMESLIDLLDNWMENGDAPPPSKSDWAELGDLDQDGVVEHGPVSLPDVACPLGVYHIFLPAAAPVVRGRRGLFPSAERVWNRRIGGATSPLGPLWSAWSTISLT